MDIDPMANKKSEGDQEELKRCSNSLLQEYLKSFPSSFPSLLPRPKKSFLLYVDRLFHIQNVEGSSVGKRIQLPSQFICYPPPSILTFNDAPSRIRSTKSS